MGEFKYITGNNIREIAKQVNELEIKKEQIVSLLYNNQYILTYYA